MEKRVFCLYFCFHLVAIFPLKEHWFKAVSPEDFSSQIGAAALRGHGCGLHHAFKYDHHLQVRVVLQRFLVHLKERRLFIDFMDNCYRRDQEDAVSAGVKPHVDVYVVQWEVLSLWCHP